MHTSATSALFLLSLQINTYFIIFHTILSFRRWSKLLEQSAKTTAQTTESNNTGNNHHRLFPSLRRFPPSRSLRQVFQASVCFGWDCAFCQHAKQSPKIMKHDNVSEDLIYGYGKQIYQHNMQNLPITCSWIIHCNLEISIFAKSWAPWVANLFKRE